MTTDNERQRLVEENQVAKTSVENFQQKLSALVMVLGEEKVRN